MFYSDYANAISKKTLVFEIEKTSADIQLNESEFDSYFEDDDFDCPENREQFRSYCNQVAQSEGFDIELDKGVSFFCGITPFPNRAEAPELYEAAEKLARLAVGMNNCRPLSEKVEFVEVQKLNRGPCSGYSYYITFLAKHCSSGQLAVYQTKVYDLICGEVWVTFFREKPQNSGLVQKPSEMPSLYSSASDKAKDYDYLISNAKLVFEIEEDSEDSSSDEDDASNCPDKDLDHKKDNPIIGKIVQTPSREENPDLYTKVEKLAQLAVGMNNCRPVCKRVEFVEVQKLFRAAGSGSFSYLITFLAKDCSSGRFIAYQTIVQELVDGTIKVVIFREREARDQE